MKDSRVCKDLNGEARHGVLAKSAKDDLTPILAGSLDDEPADDHKNKAHLSVKSDARFQMTH
jgi:hypothetical protein